ncbi:hypothetical protein CRG98_021313 [Punica granatum]|uniref:Uncharacterized protein n=1 Tax=Punica granatum TaxID=22663 RepID=A0A2I0JPT5_PUNGR|nr:hypothetical protein CRG98_021313 [Punica granatum]
MTVPVYAWLSVLLGEPLTRDGGSRYKGVNSLKSSEDLWGPVRWHSRLDPFPYSEPLTNLASYFWCPWDFGQEMKMPTTESIIGRWEHRKRMEWAVRMKLAPERVAPFRP